MKIAIMGAGGVGSYYGAKLARAGADVVFIGRGDHLDRMRRNGLVVNSYEGDFHIYAVTARAPSEVGVCDLVLFTVKTYDTDQAMESMDPMIGAETNILPLQNGVESEERLARRYGADRVLGGLCYVGAAVERAGEVIHSAAGKIIMGELDKRLTIRAATVQNILTEADIPVVLSQDIMLDKWKKLSWNVSFNAISALTRTTVGRILDIGTTRDLIRQVVGEVVEVGRARGVMLDPDLPDRTIVENRVYADLKTSMLRDAERGGRLEFESLSGVVCRYGKEAGIPTPANHFLYSILKCMDPSVEPY